jgi:molybdopterin converting factor small subunit
LNGVHTLADVFAEMNRRYENFARHLQRGEDDLPYTIFRNDTLVHLDKSTQTAVSDGDKIFIMMPVSGG